MLDFPHWLVIFSIVLIAFTLIMVGLSLIPWCKRYKSKDEEADYIASWSRMTIPHHDPFTLAPLPPYFFVNGVIGYDKFSTFV